MNGQSRDLQRSAQQVDGLLKELDQRFKLSQQIEETCAVPPVPIPEGPCFGRLRGTVVTFFGRQKHPTFDTYINKKGIEIKTFGRQPYSDGFLWNGSLRGLVEGLWTCGYYRPSKWIFFTLCPFIKTPRQRRPDSSKWGKR